MIDRIISKIKRYPFQTGIILGCLFCLILVGFIGLFQDNGKSLSENIEIIQQDYLRMAINEYGSDYDPQLAEWRYQKLGKSADRTLALMAADDSIPPQLLVSFAEAIGKKDVLSSALGMSGANGQPAGAVSVPKKGLSGVGKTILIILGLLVISAAGMYAASIIKTKNRQKRRSEMNRDFSEEPMNVITPEKARSVNTDAPDTLFDLDTLFPKNGDTEPESEKQDHAALNLKEVSIPDEIPSGESEEDDERNREKNTAEEKEADQAEENNSVIPEKDEAEVIGVPDSDDSDISEIITDADDIDSEEPDENGEMEQEEEIPGTEADDEEEQTEADGSEKIRIDLDEDLVNVDVPALDVNDDNTAEIGPEINNEDYEAGAEDPEPNTAEKPLVETEVKTDPNSEDELLQMIRGSKTTSDILEEKSVPAEIIPDEGLPEEEIQDNSIAGAEISGNDGDEDDQEENVLIHYQSVYRIGNDMYDEVFSIDQGDVFRGECGISIGETLNNTEPKAVTAFEVWLFDKDDIHTTTWYLMSDFAMSNEGISERMQQHGNCEQIRKNGCYVLETATLKVEINVLDLEYGNEMEEKSSYFTNVVFDVVAKNKQSDTESTGM